MLCKNKFFKLKVYPENREIILRKFEELDVGIDEQYVLHMGPTPTRACFECHISFENFDKLINWLEKDFNSWASIIY